MQIQKEDVALIGGFAIAGIAMYTGHTDIAMYIIAASGILKGVGSITSSPPQGVK